MNIRDRIKRLDRVRAGDLIPNPRNWRTHPQAQQDALRGILAEVGWVDAILVRETEGGLQIIDGHMRAETTPDEEVPVLVLDLSDSEADKVLATFDPIAGMAESDPIKLDALLREIDTGSEALQQMLADLAEEAGLYQDEPQSDVDAEPQIDKAEELRKKWGVESGQLWLLGEHRLLCGDSTKAEDVERVMQVERAEMMFADPPYGVDYDGGHFHSGDVKIKRSREKLAADDSTDIYAKFLPVAVKAVDGPCYVWFAGSLGRAVYEAVEDAGCVISTLLIWHKTNATYAAMNAQYKQRHEPCLYFKPKGSTLRWVGPADACSLWEFKKEGVNKLHPTQKPTELVANAIKNHKADTVLDPFSGSGTSIIACEQLNRRCRAIEISPAYVAVALQRYQDATGKTPELSQ